MEIFLLFIAAFLLCGALSRLTTMELTTTALKEELEQHDEAALDAVHELEDCVEDVSNIKLPNHEFIDPVINMYCVGRVTRYELHSAIKTWLRESKDFRVRTNQFWH